MLKCQRDRLRRQIDLTPGISVQLPTSAQAARSISMLRNIVSVAPEFLNAAGNKMNCDLECESSEMAQKLLDGEVLNLNSTTQQKMVGKRTI
jgi:hypothetical protein